ncbi:MAG TPA: hypothetical protein VMD47_00180 [Candidatus Acidoferrales bacterium]|nr:hypothetical protein [Candidatus Acidoferrales bacterium]
MDEVRERPDLRALGVGEIFDRAVTFYVRNFAIFTLIVLTLLVPLGIIEYFTIDTSSHGFTEILRQIRYPGAARSMLAPSQWLSIVGVGLLAFLFAPFTNNAVAVGVAALYAGRKPDYRDCFARVLRRWAPLLGTALLCLLVGIGAYLALLLGALIIAGIEALLFSLVPVRAFFVIVAIVAVLAFLVALMVLIICFAFALYATTLEERSPPDAIGEAFRRIVNRRELRKAALIALAYLAIEIGVLIVSGTVQLLITQTVHSDVLVQVVTTLTNAMMTAFVTVLLAVYYYDVRTRNEGLDLEVALERLTAPA